MEEQKKRVFGPSLPPKEESKDLDDQGSLPAEKKVYGPTLASSSETTKRQYGPTMLPTVEAPKRQYGPTIPSSEERSRSPERPVKVEKSTRNRSRSPPGRESWMTEVGQQGQLKMDPLNIKARTFLQKGTSTEIVEKDSAVIEEELAIEEQVKAYNASYRSRTLQQVYEEELKEGKVKAAEKDKEERIFDWERDMNASVRRMSGKSAKDLLNRSSLNDRFGSSASSKKFL